MPKMKSIRTAFVLLCIGALAVCADQKGPWRLREVLKVAADRVDDEDTSVQNARLELQMLESLNRTRVEFRPQLNLLAFSNPLFLAADLAAGFSVNRRTAPSAATMELARFALVEAEVGHARRRIDAEIDTTRQFLALAESQDIASRACNNLGTRNRDGLKVDALLSLKRITRLDAIRFQQEVTALESDCLEANTQAETAARALTRLLGVDLPSQQVQIATDDLMQFSDSSKLPESSELAQAVFESQDEFRLISQHISNLSTAPTDRKPLFEISFRNTGTRSATSAFLQARLDRLEHQFDDLKRTVAQEVEDNEERLTLSAARLRLAQKKQILAGELEKATAQRVRVGLQGAADELWASRDAERAEAEYAHLQLEWKRSFFTVLALCDPQKLDASTFLSRAANASYSKSAETKEPRASSIRPLQPSDSVRLTSISMTNLAFIEQAK